MGFNKYLISVLYGKCMETVTIQQGAAVYPVGLTHMHRPPGTIYYRGKSLDAVMARSRVAVVGSRSITPYGRAVTRQLSTQLAEQGIAIVSGLALGVDAEAHQAAVDAGGLTMAVLPSAVETIVPRANQRLSERILASGGILLSNYPAGSQNHKGNFVARNELVAALSDALLITEAARNSGSLHTAQFALDLGIPVMVVPGNITSPASVGTNHLLKSGAVPVTSYRDVMRVLGLESKLESASNIKGDNPQQQAILTLIGQGLSDASELLGSSKLEVGVFNQTLTMLEITAKIRPLGANHWGLV